MNLPNTIWPAYTPEMTEALVEAARAQLWRDAGISTTPPPIVPCAVCGNEAVCLVLGSHRCDEHRDTTVVGAIPREPLECYYTCIDNIHKCGKGNR